MDYGVLAYSVLLVPLVSVEEGRLRFMAQKRCEGVYRKTEPHTYVGISYQYSLGTNQWGGCGSCYRLIRDGSVLEATVQQLIQQRLKDKGIQ